MLQQYVINVSRKEARISFTYIHTYSHLHTAEQAMKEESSRLSEMSETQTSHGEHATVLYMVRIRIVVHNFSNNKYIE